MAEIKGPLTVGGLMDILRGLPPDRPIYILDDSMEFQANIVVTDHEQWEIKGPTVLIYCGV